MAVPTFVILSGLPGTGKTTISKMIAAHLNAAYIRIDTIEQAIKNSVLSEKSAPEIGYIIGNTLAKNNLLLGTHVVADSVNPVAASREGWRNSAKDIDCTIIEIELICSDIGEHKQRIASRVSDIEGHILPTWDDVLKNKQEYEHWKSDCITIDTAKKSIETAFTEALKYLKQS